MKLAPIIGSRLNWAAIALVLAAGLGLPSTLAHAETLTLSRSLTFEHWQGEVVRSSDFQGKWLLVYFGYTHCADLCPTGLSVLVNALDQIGPAAEHIQPLFITIDPERDRGGLLRDFTRSFDNRLVGLSGTVAQIRDAADALGVSFRKVAQGNADYAIDHSSSYTLVDPARTRAEVMRLAEPHLLAARLIDTLEKAGVPLDTVNNARAYR
jgi:protein SCO1/2